MQLWLIYALLGAFTASMTTIFTKIGVSNLSPSLAATIKGIIMAIFLIGVSFMRQDFAVGNASIFDYKKDLLFLVLTGICGALSWVFMNMALKYGNVTQVAPIDKMSVVMSVVIAMLLFKETLSIKGILGVILIALGGILVALN